MKTILLPLFLFVSVFVSNAQSVSIDNANFNTTYKYGQGSSISVPIIVSKNSGCIAYGNSFNIELVPVGQTAGTQIGSYLFDGGTYADFVNGVIPANTPPGNYQIKLTASKLLGFSALSQPFGVFASANPVVASAGNTSGINGTKGRILIPQLFYGWCSYNAATNPTIDMVDSSTGVATTDVDTFIVKDGVNGFITRYASTQNNPTTINLSQERYYVLTVKANNAAGIVGTYSVYILNTSWLVTPVAKTGTVNSCLPDTATFQLFIDSISAGIRNNFPGFRYQVDWGDGKTEFYSYCELIANNGKLSHAYTTTSCGLQNNQFLANVSLINTMKPGVTISGCAQVTKPINIQVFSKPTSAFTCTTVNCVNKPVQFTNTSTAGLSPGGSSTTCSGAATYVWYVNGKLLNKRDSFPNATSPNLANDTIRFLQVGLDTITLVVDNGTCAKDTFSNTICIVKDPVPNFVLDTISKVTDTTGCGPLTFTPFNVTDSAICSKWQFTWNVLDSFATRASHLGGGADVPAPSTSYSLSFPNGQNNPPSVTINYDPAVPSGWYNLQLVATNACTSKSVSHNIHILGSGGVKFPKDTLICGLPTGSISFNSPTLQPKFTGTPLGATPYSWSVTDFNTGLPVSGITINTVISQFPTISFPSKYGTYWVKAQFSSTCGTAKDSMIVGFTQALTDTIRNKVRGICYSQKTMSFTSDTTGSGTIYWITRGDGSFNNPSIKNPIYTFGPQEQANGNAIIIDSLVPIQPSGCPSVIDSVSIYISPKNTLNLPFNTTTSICSNVKLNDTLISTIPNSVFTWTSTASAGITGNTQSGTPGANNKITDVLINKGSTNGTVTYIITPAILNNCVGDPYTLTITVFPEPLVAKANIADTICSFTNSGITLSTTNNLPTMTYNWVSHPEPGIKGFSPTGSVFSQPFQINDVLSDSDRNATHFIYYTITPVSGNSCVGQSINDTIWVKPGGAKAIAGPNVVLCNQTSYTMQATNPAPDAGFWLLDGATTLLPNPSSGPNANNAVISPITQSKDYSYKWVINSATVGCPADTGYITIKNRPDVTKADAGRDTVICNYTNGLGSITLTGNLDPTRPYETGTWTLISSPKVGGTPTGVIPANKSIAILNFLKTGDYVLEWSIKNDGNCVTRDTMHVYAGLDNNIISSDQTLCGSQAPVVFTGTVPVGGVSNPSQSLSYQWLYSYGNSPYSFVNISGETGLTYNPNAQAFYTNAPTVYYTRLVTSTACPNSSWYSDTVKINSYPGTKAIYGYTQDTGCTTFQLTSSNIKPTYVQPILNPNDASISYEWYRHTAGSIAPAIFIGSGPTFPTQQIIGSGISDTIFFVSKSSAGCVSDTFRHVFSTRFSPAPSFTPSTTNVCNSSTVTFVNTTPNPQNSLGYVWYFDRIDTQYVEKPNPVLFSSNPGIPVVYSVTMYAFNKDKGCRDSTKVTQNITINAIPKAQISSLKSVGCSPFTAVFTDKTLNADTVYIDYGDGSKVDTFPISTSTNVHPHTYITNVRKTYIISIKAVNNCGSDSTTLSILVDAQPITISVTAPGSEQSGCAPNIVHFNLNSSGATSFEWHFTNYASTVTTNPVDIVPFKYDTAGIYVVKVKASNLCYDTTVTVTPINVFATPKASFVLLKDTVCVGEMVNFTNTSNPTTPVIPNSVWTFYNGSSVSVANSPTFTYSSANIGVDTVTLVSLIPAGAGLVCSDTVKQPITIVGSQKGSFTYNISSNTCIPQNVTFTNTSVTTNSFPNFNVLWNFDTLAPIGTLGNTATGNIATHIYDTTKTFNISMTATSANGCVFKDNQSISITAPAGTWTFHSGYVCGNKPVTFTVNNLSNTDSLHFYFGDGSDTVTASTVNSVTHIYTCGTYEPYVILVNKSTNCKVQLPPTLTDTVKIDYVKAAFKTNISKSCGTSVANFTDASTTCQGIKTWDWLLGGIPSLSNIQNPTTTYNVSSTYYVSLTVTSNSGCFDTLTIPTTIKVNTQPTITSTTVTPQIGSSICTNRSFTLNAAISSVDPVMPIWTINHQPVLHIDTGYSVTDSFGNAGTYNYTLVITTSNSCSDSKSGTIVVNQTPKIFITPNTLPSICRGGSLQLTGNSSGNGTTYVWSPVSPIFSSNIGQTVTVTPPSDIKLIVIGTDQNGCSDTSSTFLNVLQDFTLTLTPKVDTICLGQKVNLTVAGATTYSWTPYDSTISCDSCPNPVVTPKVTTTYKVNASSKSCFNHADSVVITVGNYPTVNIGAGLTVETGSLVPLNATYTNGPMSSWIWSPSDNLSCNNCPNPIASVRGTTTYQLVATNIYGCSTTSNTKTIHTFCENTQVFIPNGFTPDGDGINDILMVRGTGIKQVKNFRIYNRWGQVVFERANFSPNDPQYGWDGKIRGTSNIAPTDAYVYWCEVVCDNDQSFTYKGNVSIIR